MSFHGPFPREFWMIIQAVLDIQLCELSRRLRFSRFYWIKRLTKSEYKVLEFSAWDKCTTCSLTNRKVCLGGRHVHVSQLPLFWAWYINRNERHQASPFFSKSLIGGFVICLKQDSFTMWWCLLIFRSSTDTIRRGNCFSFWENTNIACFKLATETQNDMG